MTHPRSVVITPPLDAWQTVHGSRRYFHGGDRYRRLADRILGANGEVRHLDFDPEATPDERAAALDALLPEADAVVVAPWLGLGDPALPAFDVARLGLAPELRVIAGTFDYRLGWIDLDEAGRREIAVVDTSRTMTPSVAEFAVGITFALLRDIPAAIDVVRGGGWPDAPKDAGAFVFRDLAESRVGLAGYGSINRHYRRFIAPYGCEVRIFDPFVGDETARSDDVTLTGSLVELARESDILVVAIPPTPTTLGVVDASVIDALASGSLFVLVSRMAVVEQDALWRRVRAGELRAAVDVYDPEPPPRNAWYRTSPNVLPTPHIAGNVQFAHERCFTEACADAVRVLEGGSPRHPATTYDKRLYEGSPATGV